MNGHRALEMVADLTTRQDINSTSIVTSTSYGGTVDAVTASVMSKRVELLTLVDRQTTGYQEHSLQRRRGDRPRKSMSYRNVVIIDE